MPEEIVPRVLRLPGYGVYAWEAEEVTNTLQLRIRQTARSRTMCVAAAGSRSDVSPMLVALWCSCGARFAVRFPPVPAPG
jgi:hypothetical protein